MAAKAFEPQRLPLGWRLLGRVDRHGRGKADDVARGVAEDVTDT